MTKVAIVGAGAGGLAAAYDLVQAGCKVTVFEADGQVGGLAAGFKRARWDWSVEKYYHHWFASDRHILGLIDELGWGDKVLFPWPMTAVYHGGGFYPLDGPLSKILPGLTWVDDLPGAGSLARVLHVLRFPGLSPIEALRAGLVGLYLLAIRWEPLEKVTATDWLRRHMGAHCFETLWRPLLEGKFGPHVEEVNMAWFWARLNARTPRLGTFEGGFQAFMDALAEHLRTAGVDIRLRAPVERLEPLPQGGLMLRHSEDQESFDQCLVTLSPKLMAKTVPSLPSNYLEGLSALKSMGAVVMILALKHRLSEREASTGITCPNRQAFPF